jgi:hypothetical protein
MPTPWAAEGIAQRGSETAAAIGAKTRALLIVSTVERNFIMVVSQWCGRLAISSVEERLERPWVAKCLRVRQSS